MPKYNRRASNELSASVCIDQLRTLQTQLALMIEDAEVDDGPNDSLENSLSRASDILRRSSDVGDQGEGDVEAPPPTYRKPRQLQPALEGRVCSVGDIGDDDEHDIESGRAASDGVIRSFRMGRSGSEHVRSQPVVAEVVGSLPAQLELSRMPTRRMSNASALSEESAETTGAASSMTSASSALDRTTRTFETAGTSGSDSLDISSRWRRRFQRSSKSRSQSPSKNVSGSRSKSPSIRPSLADVGKKTSAIFGGRRHASKAARETLPSYEFLLQNEGGSKEERSLLPNTKWWHGVFFFSLVAFLACIVTLWAPYPIGARMSSAQVAEMPWSNGCQGIDTCICPRETICADDLLSMIFLTIARCSAWFDYPLYMLMFLSKANNLNHALQRTALRVFINFSDQHKVHSLFGVIVAIESTSHAFFHTLRWARRKNDIQLLWMSKTGVTGMIAMIFLPLIVLPMTVPFLKKRMRFEWRKFLHYFSILWAVALMCHAPQRIFWMIGVPLFIYAADKLVEGMFKTHLLENCHFQRLGETSCIVEFENPSGFGKQNSAYVYLMLPWVNKYQYHAFTVFPSSKPNHSTCCIYKTGDWTGELLRNITVPAHKPAFVVGPYLSPFSSPAMDSENLVAVASGIGVTPAFSLIRQYSSTSRRLNLVWICRDPGLVEHWIQNINFGKDGYVLIYYTGKERKLIIRNSLPSNVLIFNGRPDLERTISGIVHAIASGEGLPEEMSKKVVTQTPAELRSKLLLEKALSIYSLDQLYEYTVKASNYYNETGEELVNTVNYQGVLSTMRHLLGEDAARVEKRIIENFERVDSDGDCLMDHSQFKEFFDLMLMTDGNKEAKSLENVRSGLKKMNTCRNIFESGRGSGKDESKDEFGIMQYLHGDANGRFQSKNWSMLYCGGSQPVLDSLKTYKKKYGIELSVEKFDW
ncbi:hypothetical protein THAOC_20318 [Thalassiosira oceanica]|uniref:Ferric reductase NAD binding domain-containing protein n=1 Tax=Thalassiosira oceanica TaxID=159749 RepID=K0SET6_THAOC|nr:hypothetical protein THAOC_20318 [Thalassiosira oceanica]|eukprot:EJK59461.1 hypothetical protein THAOC_20318 [Thalassiosira oceanica]